jgi:hypothetical protein
MDNFKFFLATPELLYRRMFGLTVAMRISIRPALLANFSASPFIGIVHLLVQRLFCCLVRRFISLDAQMGRNLL